MREIAKCPLCGSSPEVISDRGAPTIDDVVRCPMCKLELIYHDDSYVGAISMWNDAVKSGDIKLFRIKIVSR